MNDIVALALTSVLAIGVLVWALWVIWQLARNRKGTLSTAAHVLGVITGTVALGVVLPPTLMGILDPFLVWLVYAILAVTAATLLGWRWFDLELAKGRLSALAVSAAVFIAVMVMALIAAT